MTTDELKRAARRRVRVTVDGRVYDRVSAVRWYLDKYGGERIQAELIRETTVRLPDGRYVPGPDTIELASPEKVEVYNGGV